MSTTLMAKEIREAPNALRIQQQSPELIPLKNKPELLLTFARGTSDHAAEYLSYLLMRYAGIPAASIPPSLNTIYNAPWQAKNALALLISQSGGSQDLSISAAAMKNANINTLGLLNTIPSPLAERCSEVCHIEAGDEKSVAATKSFVATLSAGLRLFSGWLGDESLLPALDQLPEKLEQAQELDWSKAIDALADCDRLYIVGRGAGLPIAKEAALKCKETCLLQGEAFSGAEVKHGPMALVNEKQHVLIFAPPDDTQADLIDLAKQFKEMGANVLLAADDKVAERDLPLIDAGHDALQGLTVIQSFYNMIEQLSRRRGIDTDNPPNLRKVTTTK